MECGFLFFCFLFVPRFLRQLSAKVVAAVCRDGLFDGYSCCCGLQMCARNVSCGCRIRLQCFPDACDGYTFPLSWVTCWVNARSLGGSSLAFLSLGKTWDFQLESYVRIKYLVIESVVTSGFGVKTIVLSCSWKCLSIFFQQLSGS